MDAREYFEDVRAAARMLERCIRRIEAMRAAEGLRGASLSPAPSRTGVSDPMRRTDARMDAEKQAVCEAEAYRAEIRAGREVCAGLRRACPHTRWGDVLEARYCDAMEWNPVATIAGVTRKTCQTDANAAFDWLDAHGIAAAREMARTR
ncbi:hypothetical protein [Collinsella ihumii]|uniref:Uncharacterized protein n=1 Tax=Collinsella ihumii TaxID=1720204 RepID=A0ABT7XDN0_9ACTN|nr:hypothetical protein [Collinsella ihumii]MDN0063517.1 hypothetical protein [Collinsella ihumii]